MENVTLLNNTTPEQLTETILNGIKIQIDSLKENFSLKEPEDFISRMEVAKLLKISLSTVHDWSNKKILKPYKYGNRTYYSRKEIIQRMYNSNTL